MALESATLGQIAITVHDVPRAVAFYRDTLGLQLLFEVSGLAFFSIGGIRLMLSKPEQPTATHSSGSEAFHDIMANACVVRQGKWGRNRDGRRFGSQAHRLRSAIFAAALLAASFVAVMRYVLGSHINLPEQAALKAHLEPLVDLAGVIYDGKGSEDVRAFVKNVNVTGSVDGFPDELTESSERIDPRLVQELKGQSEAVTVNVEVTRHGYKSILSKSRVIDRVMSVVGSRLANKRQFIWLNIGVKDTFGPIEVVHGERYVLVFFAAEKNGRFAVKLIDPDRNTFFLFFVSPSWHPRDGF